MENIKAYTDEASGLVKILFELPDLLSSPLVFKKIEEELVAFDNQVQKIREILATTFIAQNAILEKIVPIDKHWKEAIIESIFGLKSSEFEHLLAQPNIFFYLYLCQDQFPSDGLERIVRFFAEGLGNEVIILNIPLKELIKQKEDVTNTLDEIVTAAIADIGTRHQYFDCVIYLCGFFEKEVTIYFNKLASTTSEEKYLFWQECTEAIAAANKKQLALPLN